MDALTRIEPAARPLLREVDAALATLGAPAEHRIWALLREVGATPADAVAYFTDLDAEPFHHIAASLRERGEGYARTSIPTQVSWQGGAADAYAQRAGSLDRHLREGMAERLAATASYAEDIARWQQRCRDHLARTLAEVLTSAEAVVVRLEASNWTTGSARTLAGVVRAAADIGAWVLQATLAALADGRDQHRRWTERLGEVHYRAPVDATPGRFDATIHLRH
jgi:hypothetical protein